jgi:hypothetical protein
MMHWRRLGVVHTEVTPATAPFSIAINLSWEEKYLRTQSIFLPLTSVGGWVTKLNTCVLKNPNKAEEFFLKYGSSKPIPTDSN